MHRKVLSSSESRRVTGRKVRSGSGHPLLQISPNLFPFPWYCNCKMVVRELPNTNSQTPRHANREHTHKHQGSFFFFFWSPFVHLWNSSPLLLHHHYLDYLSDSISSFLLRYCWSRSRVTAVFDPWTLRL